MNILLIGAQASGKGTQAELLTHMLGISHVSSGDLFRKEIAEQTERGRYLQTYLNRGELVPDHLTVTMILRRLQRPDCKSGVVLDGFPRTIVQAKALDDGLHICNEKIHAVVYLRVLREKLLERISGRFICQAHQHVYNISSSSPKVPGICDIDGSELFQRSDDSSDVVEHRLDLFFSQTLPLLAYYEKQGTVLEVDGDQPIDKVHQAVVDALYTHTLCV
ncbi:adenylate kinase [Reticulibacter mediterranei]|uniref:Adenylate kinase n=1 Tax=Reticulibacter mediterranei TaxID=2778369 RepID=A0A8J3J1R4_9CHLR|nr:adenylate kinase [Reticulibacter mediterranei]GHP00022.1 adenylate kinase [Reticulibacter mediterranei]